MKHLNVLVFGRISKVGEMRRRRSKLVYQADGNAVVYLCRAWHTETLEQQWSGRRRGQRESSCLTVIILSKVEGVLELQQFHCSKLEPTHSPLWEGGVGGILTLTQSLLTN